MLPRSHRRKRRLVVAAVVRRDDGRYLLARRLPGSHLGGLWEFPGGELEDNETPEQAVARELREELGVDVAADEPLTFAWHRDNVRDVVLLFYRAHITDGEPRGLQGQEFGWFAPAELPGLAMPPADARLIRRLADGQA